MKLVSLACPHCKAPLAVNQELTKATCNYCGHQFLIDNEIQYSHMTEEDMKRIGKAMERARTEQEESIAAKTTKKVYAVYSGLLELRENNARLVNLQTEFKAKKTSLFWTKVFHWLTGPIKGEILAVVGIELVMYLTIKGMIENASGIKGFFTGVAISAALYCAMRLLRLYYDHAIIKRQGEYDQLEKEIDELKTTNQEMKTKADFEFVPVKYRNENALKYMYEALRVRRVHTLAEAMNQYNIEQQQKFQRQQMEAQTRAAQEQMRAAQVRQGADIIGTVVTAGAVIKVGRDIVKVIRELK
ncbi:MAG: hypothetical protein IKQ25_11480 [Lachnospiraceae bacterium]|nr:hypothetical protein [Lachnospiraceae bacterium]